MPHPSQKSLRRCLEILDDLLREEPELRAERSGALGEFFGERASLGGEKRFREWFFFERRSQRYGEPPASTLHERLLERVAHEDRDFSERILDQVFSAFEFVPAGAEGGASLRDLLTQREYPLADSGGLGSLEAGDAVIGRIFPSGGEDFILSPETGLRLRSPDVIEALRRDLVHARRERRGDRLSQRQMEGFFWANAVEPARIPLEEIEHRWETLVRGGPLSLQFSAVRKTLEDAADAGNAAADVLNRLAFEANVSIDAARVLLLGLREEIKAARDRNQAARLAPCGCGSGSPYAECCLPKDAVAAFEEGKARGEDIETLFKKLEKTLDLEDVDEADDAEPPGGSSSEIPLLIQEFLWERAAVRPGEPDAREPVEDFGHYLENEAAPPISHLEEIGARHFVAFLAVSFLRGPNGTSPEAAAAYLDAVGQLCAWADQEQGTELETLYRPIREKLQSSLSRIVEANRTLRDDSGSHFSPRKMTPGVVSVYRIVSKPRTTNRLVRGPGRRKDRDLISSARGRSLSPRRRSRRGGSFRREGGEAAPSLSGLG